MSINLGEFFQLLDVRTLVFVLGIASLLQAGAITLQVIAVQEYRGIREATAGNISLAIGFLLISFRDVLPDWMTIVIANSLILVGTALFYHAVCLFIGYKTSWGWIILIFLIGIGVLLYFTYTIPNLAARIVGMSATGIALLVATVWTLIRGDTRKYQRAAYLVAFAFSGYILLLFGRAVFAILTPPETLYITSPLQIINFVVLFIASNMWTLGFTLIISQRLQHNLNELATIDGLTHLLNRRAMVHLIEAEFARKARDGADFSILLLDIDHFKQVNDTHGHIAGDGVLLEMSKILTRMSRSQDIVSRWGGEEFILFLPMTLLKDAYAIGERLRAEIEQTWRGSLEITVPVTISVGISSSQHSNNLDEIYQQADDALYEAKKTRNLVIVSGGR